MAFLEMVLHEEKRIGHPLPLDGLIIFSCLRLERRLTSIDLDHSTQKSEQKTRVTLGKVRNFTKKQVKKLDMYGKQDLIRYNKNK